MPLSTEAALLTTACQKLFESLLVMSEDIATLVNVMVLSGAAKGLRLGSKATPPIISLTSHRLGGRKRWVCSASRIN